MSRAIRITTLLAGFLLTWRMHGAYAEVRKLGRGTVIKVEDGPDLVLESPHFLLDRLAAERAIANAGGVDLLRDEVARCNLRLQESLAKASTSPAVTLAKWFAVGVAVVSAFAIGIAVGG